MSSTGAINVEPFRLSSLVEVINIIGSCFGVERL